MGMNCSNRFYIRSRQTMARNTLHTCLLVGGCKPRHLGFFLFLFNKEFRIITLHAHNFRRSPKLRTSRKMNTPCLKTRLVVDSLLVAFTFFWCSSYIYFILSFVPCLLRSTTPLKALKGLSRGLLFSWFKQQWQHKCQQTPFQLKTTILVILAKVFSATYENKENVGPWV